MGVVMVPVILQLVRLCVIGFAFTVQGSTGHNISPSPASFSEIPPTEGTPGPIHQIKSSSGNAPSSVFQPNGSDLHPPVVLPPLASTPVPKIVKGLVPSLSPSTPTAVLPPHNTAPPPAIVQGHIPSLSPSTPIVSQPDNTAPPPLIVQGRAPSLSPTTPSVSPPYKTAPPPLIVQGHTPSLSPTTPSVSPPYKTAPPPLIVQGHAPSLSPTTPIVSPPSKTAPSPLIVSKGNATSLFPNTPTEPAPYNTAPPPLVVQGHVPSMPPNVPQTKAPVRKNPVPATVAPVPVATPSNALPQNAPSIHPSMPGTLPPTAHQRNASHNKAPIPEPIAPDVSTPRQSGQNPQAAHPVMPGITPSILPGPVASPTSELPRNSPATPPVMPRESPSILPVVPYEDVDPHVPPASTPPPSIDRKKDGIPVAAPPNETPKPLPPLNHSPTKDPHFPPASTPPPSIDRKKDAIPVAAPPNETPKKDAIPPVNRSPTKAPSTHKAMRHSLDAPLPSPSSPKSPLNEGHHSPASSPSTSFDKPHNARNKITSPAPASSYLVSPPASKQRGPVIPPANLPTSRQTHYAPPPFNPGSSLSPFHLPHLSSVSHVSPAPSPSPIAVPGHTEIPDLSPKVSPSGSPSRSPKMPPLPPIRALPPPPPNEDCSGTTCTEPYTNTPPGAPCSCVWPMQVGLRLSVALYTFFPLVSELAEEIAAGVFMKQSQVRIMGANAASQQPEKTVVLIDLVPLGQQFDNTTALLIDQRFWLKQVVIKASFFGDYEVLYVHYPGLPPSPPLPPSSINVIDGGPYSGNDNNGRTIKPLGVDVGTRQHKNGLSGGIIAIIILSVAVTMILVSAVAWVLLFKHRDHVCQPVTTPQPLPSSLSKPSGIAGSITGSGLSSASLSFGSSIATYTGSAKTFSTSDIEKATDNFDDSKILGEGGFGRVYSGVLEDGTKVAVKVLKRDDQQGGREFLAEVEMLSRLHHRNLVKLIGICTEERSRCLVYELIPNGSVESHLHGVDKESAPLGWDARIKIALGAARGLAYLHEDSSPRVIHRDFKSSNILLEHDFTPKVSDFGLARTALDEQSRHISTRVMGTFGYVAPEYAMTGHLLVKSDVYSYGVVLLELLTGRKPVDMSQPPGQENLVAWARPLLTNKEGLETMVDPTLGSDFPFDSVGKVAAIASMCVQPEVSHRPFMGEVVQALKLVSNECDEAKEVGSRSSCQDDLSIDFEATVSTGSGQVPDPSQRQHSGPNYDSGFDPERGLSDLFGTTERFGRQESGSFRRYSSSGPLRTGRGRQFWQKLRRLSGGSVSEHGVMFRLWPGSH